jgi:serine/threonine-protein kinase
MPFKSRVVGAGKLVVLGVALLATYLLFAATAMRVALKAREVEVPDLRNHTVAEATTVLTELGLPLKVDDARRSDAKIQVGRIATQDPEPGITARRQRSIRVWLSAGPRSATIPRLTGETERTAHLRLQEDGVGVAQLSEIRSADYPVGSVVAQDPPPASRGTQVSLLVNRGERSDTYVMPDLIGVNGDRAAEILRTHGFRVAVVSDHPYPGVPAGVVLRQSPQAGFQIAPGEPISIEVSR